MTQPTFPPHRTAAAPVADAVLAPPRGGSVPARAGRAAGRWAKRLAALAVAAAAAAPLGGCQNEGNPDAPGPIQVVSSPGFAREWAANLPVPAGDEVVSAHVRGDWLFVYTKKGTAYGLTRANGQPLLALVIPGGTYRLYPPLVLKDALVFPTTNTLEIYTLGGVPQRSLDVGAAIRAECVGERTDVYVPVDSPEGGARIKRYDLTQRAVTVPVWELQAWKGGLASSPALHGDVVFMAAEVGTVYAVAASNREPVWPLPGHVFDARGPVVAPLRADDVGLYVSTVEGRMYCVSRTSGVVKWQWFGNGPLEDAPVVLADTVYVRDANRGWAAVDKVEDPNVTAPQYNRKERWLRSDVAQVLSQDERYTYVKTKDNFLAGLDKRTGQPRFRSGRNDFHVFATNPTSPTVYTVTRTGRVVAVRPVLEPGQTGELVMLDEDKAPEAEVIAAR